MRTQHVTILLSTLALSANFVVGLSIASADDCDETCQALRKAQDPLADVRAIMTDNTIAVGTAKDNTSYNFQVQPVYSIGLEDDNNLILRGIVPVLGVYDGTYFPWIGPTPVGGSYNWGISDIMMQAFYVPANDGGIKFGFGPQVSLKTRTDSVLAGPGWGAGAAVVAFGFAGDYSYGGILGHHWGEDSFSLTTVQPIVMYNMELFGGSYIGYNNSITYDWNADQWTVPAGLVFGKTFLFDSGYALDANIGAYSIVEGPRGSADWQAKFGVSVFFP